MDYNDTTWTLSQWLFPTIPRGVNVMACAYTVWTPELVTGSAVIDEQHKQLINALNSLFDAERHGNGDREVRRALSFLLKYTAKHFADEEALQEKYEYPGYEGHKRLHTEFTGVALKMAREYLDSPSNELVSHARSVIGQWVVHHIKSEDFKMAAYILNRMDGEHAHIAAHGAAQEHAHAGAHGAAQEHAHANTHAGSHGAVLPAHQLPFLDLMERR